MQHGRSSLVEAGQGSAHQGTSWSSTEYRAGYIGWFSRAARCGTGTTSSSVPVRLGHFAAASTLASKRLMACHWMSAHRGKGTAVMRRRRRKWEAEAESSTGFQKAEG